MELLSQPRLLVFAGLLSVCLAASSPKMSGGRDDASDVTWAHAVNSREALEKALAGPIDFLEADISLGHVEGSSGTPPVPIMAHPPDTTSDISLDAWLDTVVTTRPDKGIKLDFKSLAVLEPSLIILQRYASKLNSSVWLNADVLPGPVDSRATPVPVEEFLQLCNRYSANATLSVGWTTDWHATLPRDAWRYGWRHVRQMAEAVRCRKRSAGRPHFTFPVRAIFASRSAGPLGWLLSVVPGSTLTVWTGRHDPLTVDDLLAIRASFADDAVYYDVPEKLSAAFDARKNAVARVPSHAPEGRSGRWMTFTRGQGDGCSSLTYVQDDAIVFGKSLATAVLRKNVLVVPDGDRDLKITGRVKFFDTGDRQSGDDTWHELSMVVADVSSFSKNASTVGELDLTSSDSDVVWSVINSSVLYTFRHRYGEERTSCRLFKLDSSEDRSFEVWTVPCDAELESGSFDDVARNGVSDVSSRKRLVLPEGPFMVGFLSAGDEHVALYDLEIKGRGEAVTSRSGSSKTLATSTVAASLFCALLYVLL